MKRKVIENYALCDVLGEGSFGKVFRALHTFTSQEFAVKVIPIQKFQENSRLEACSANEVKNLTRIQSNPYIIKFVEMLKTPNNFYFVYQFCNGKTLESKLKEQTKLSEIQALKIFNQLLEAFKVLNKYNIMHRDLKPDNIFFHDGNIKLGDFGFCKTLMTQDEMTSIDILQFQQIIFNSCSAASSQVDVICVHQKHQISIQPLYYILYMRGTAYKLKSIGAEQTLAQKQMINKFSKEKETQIQQYRIFDFSPIRIVNLLNMIAFVFIYNIENKSLTMRESKKDSKRQKLNHPFDLVNINGMYYKQVVCLRPNSTFVNSIMLFGVLEKQSDSGLFYNNRFLFIIAPGVLKYRNEQPTQPKIDENNHTQIAWKKQQKMENVESCTLNERMVDIAFKHHKEKWIFRAKDVKTAEAWVNAIQKAIIAEKNPKIIVNENPLALQDSNSPPPVPNKRKDRIQDKPVIIYPKSAQQTFLQLYRYEQNQFKKKLKQQQQTIQQYKRDPVFELLTAPEEWFLLKFQKQAIKYFKALVDQSQVKPQWPSKFDVQFYSSLQKEDFDNLAYIYQKTYNIGCLRVIPSILLSYKGIKALIRYKLSFPKVVNKNSEIITQLKAIEDRTRIQAPNFDDPNNKVVLEYYEIDALQMKKTLHLDSQKVFIINSLIGYIPPVGEVHITAELLKNKNFVGHVFDPENIEVQIVNGIIDECLKQFLTKVDKMNYIISNSLEFNKLLLRHGLSRFYLPKLYELSALDFTKSICASQMIIAVISQILNQNLQNSDDESKNELTVDLLNVIVGGTQESHSFWNQLICEKVWGRFGVMHKKKEVNIQYILAGVIEHNGIQINYQKMKQGKKSQPTQYINIQFFQDFKMLHRGYSVSFNDKHTKIQELVLQKTVSAFNSLIALLDLKTSPLPEWLIQSSLYEDVLLLLATHIPPTYSNFQPYHHLNIYQYKHFSPVKTFDFELLKIHLEWSSLAQQYTQIQLLFQSFLERATFWIGDYSPLHGELYLIIAKFSLKRQNYSDCCALVETAIMNYIHLEGMFSLKLVDCYSLLTKCQLGRNQSISSYQRAKKILQNKGLEDTPVYLKIIYELAHEYMLNSNFQQSISLYFQVISLAQRLGQTTILIDSFIMLSKNYTQVGDTERHNQLVSHALMILERIDRRQDFVNILQICIANSVLKQSPVSIKYMNEILLHTQMENSLDEYNSCIRYLMANSREIERFLENLSSEEYLHSLLEQYRLSPSQPKTMLYYAIQVIGSKIFHLQS